jgi:hypothetical protein
LLTLQFARSAQVVAPVLGAAVSKVWVWYLGLLTTKPLYTKSVTAAIIGLLGDAFAQWMEEAIRNRNTKTTTKVATATSTTKFDSRRCWANSLDNLLISGPILHYAYNALELLLPVASATTGTAANIAALTQVLLDDFIFGAFFVVVTFVTTGLVEGYSVREVAGQIQRDLGPTVRAGWVTSLFCMPMEFTIIRYFPLSFRVLGMNIIGIFWGAMISYMSHRNRHSGHEEEDSATTTTTTTVPVGLPAAAAA